MSKYISQKYHINTVIENGKYGSMSLLIKYTYPYSNFCIFFISECSVLIGYFMELFIGFYVYWQTITLIYPHA
ncbi:hypothetical protein XNC1_4345 [Xenorhabdus nematophila ATCC 19061]|uniref:Uncharacterized protein n=1 Tax=Xenorhabdus nematophila (strain ATCC 19061 / DSM 3370 / CCUG 14189 / LMG 1036 / NCIMB 9965 / AN6) TaxID=406817 RepID=D3VEB6_XENNA|nr:hypothetical protein XNC1_4345 [Xenorhabdus nematophila ATCC 19061]CEE90864.1 hypothetical protein XNA1_1740009 [Xenorhabdus nematophila str. Anatoliense]CEE94305.1 hypothetical protein XNA1_4580009 [Xenorhabdus nematophila str. Anatoliense]CEK25182.1 hypothetical protein XNC2_4195 [Xenorhabdus nematophila AN6/1]